MAHSMDGYALDTLRIRERTPTCLWKLRLAFGWIFLFAALVGLLAFSWDIQWHEAVGRDRTLTAPHLFILGSAALMGLAALTAVLIETAWARHSTPIAKSGTTFAGFFSSSPGAYLVGYGALDAAISFPIDQYWHTLYGIDDDPARAGFTLPFAIAPQGATSGSWIYYVTSLPQGSLQKNGKIIMSGNRVATSITASVSPDPQRPGGVQGNAEITVQGRWNLQVVVDGPSGQYMFNVPVTATTLPAIPIWSGWAIGFVPVYGIIVFLLIQVGRKRQDRQGTLQKG